MSAWFLRTKLVARECEDFKSLLAVLIVELREFFVVLFRCASFGRHIHDKENIPLIVRHLGIRRWVRICKEAVENEKRFPINVQNEHI